MVTSQPDVPPSQAQNLSHLHPNARQAAMQPVEQRLALIRANRWIGYPRAAEAVDRLEELLTWPARQRMPNVLLIGPTNNGKSMIIERFRREHPPESYPNRSRSPYCVCRCRPTRHRHGSGPRYWSRSAHRRGHAPALRQTIENRSPWS